MMLFYAIVATLAYSVSCMSISDVVKNSPTFVPKRCLLDVAKGSCRDETRNYFFNVTAGYCQPFIYNGCGGNWNRFTTLSDCHKSCACALPPETGPCRGYVARWFYSPSDGCCRPFMYGGCGGNSNSYGTWTECSEVCGYPTSDSSWWTWGAQWRNATTAGSNVTYGRNDFMRDWMLYMLFANGESFEMEDMAALIAQAHVLGLGKKTGSIAGSMGSSLGFGSQFSAGENGLFGSQIGGQDLFGGQAAGQSGMMSAFGNGLFDADAMENQFGTANWGLQTGQQGSFTPLGHVGSTANEEHLGSGLGIANSNFGFWDQSSGGGQFWGSQRNIQGGGGQTNFAKTGMFGLEQFGSQNSFNQASRWGNSDKFNWGTRKPGPIGKSQNTPPFENVATEILHYIRKLGRGELRENDLLQVGKRFGAISANGKLNINLLASEMVRALQGGPKIKSNMASLQGIAKSVGAIDNKGNINIPLLVNTLTRSMSDSQFSELLRTGVPTTDEFNWLTKRADVSRTRIGQGGKGARNNFVQRSNIKDWIQTDLSRGIRNDGRSGTFRDVSVINLGGKRFSTQPRNGRVGLASGFPRTLGTGSRDAFGSSGTLSRTGGVGVIPVPKNTGGVAGLGLFGKQKPLTRGNSMSSVAAGRGLNRSPSSNGSGTLNRGVKQGGNRRLAGRGGMDGPGRGFSGLDGMVISDRRGLNAGGLNAGDGFAFSKGRAAVTVNEGKSSRMGSYGKK